MHLASGTTSMYTGLGEGTHQSACSSETTTAVSSHTSLYRQSHMLRPSQSLHENHNRCLSNLYRNPHNLSDSLPAGLLCCDTLLLHGSMPLPERHVLALRYL
ncbi:hypothetical protein BD309DRAFT_761786 [Dichomitus squalens]|nr:hypothetical protein BD309DRAFT_761786 [Dichomitus squalens]